MTKSKIKAQKLRPNRIDYSIESNNYMDNKDSIKGHTKTRKRKLPKALSKSKFVDLVNSTTNPRDRLIFLLGGTLGLRVGETSAAQVSNYDSIERIFKVLNGKTGDRIIPIPEYTAKYLNWYIKAFNLKAHDFLLGVKYTLTGWINADTSLTRSHIDYLCKQYGKKIDIPYLHYHMLRHSYVTFLIEADIDPITIQNNCGWKNLDMLSIYTHLVISTRRKKTDRAFNTLGEELRCQRKNQQQRTLTSFYPPTFLPEGIESDSINLLR